MEKWVHGESIRGVLGRGEIGVRHSCSRCLIRRQGPEQVTVGASWKVAAACRGVVGETSPGPGIT